MKAISLWQPWATLIALGEKRIETRSWKTSHRGWLAIHATKRTPPDVLHSCERDEFILPLFAAGYGSMKDLPTGAIVAVAELRDCVPTDGPITFALPPERERGFGDYSPGRWAWLLEEVRRIEPPLEMNGARGLWTVEEGVF